MSRTRKSKSNSMNIRQQSLLPNVSGQEGTENRADLRDLYKIALDEYRFQVKLNWDRTAFCLTLSSALLWTSPGLVDTQLSLSKTGVGVFCAKQATTIYT
jgi:hypothetical protein